MVTKWINRYISAITLTLVILWIISTVAIKSWDRGIVYMVLRLHKAAANSKGERRNEGFDIPAENHAPDVGLIEDIKFL